MQTYKSKTSESYSDTEGATSWMKLFPCGRARVVSGHRGRELQESQALGKELFPRVGKGGPLGASLPLGVCPQV